MAVDFPRLSKAPSACSIYRIARCSGPVFGPRSVLCGCSSPPRVKVFRSESNYPRSHPANPSLHPVHASVTTPPQSLSSLENTDPPFASHSPTLCAAKPTLFLLLGSGHIPTFLIGNRYPLDPQLLRLAHIL